mgnify:CR=1 FL=1
MESPNSASPPTCLLYTSDAADDLLCVDLGGRRIIKKKKTNQHKHTYNRLQVLPQSPAHHNTSKPPILASQLNLYSNEAPHETPKATQQLTLNI